MLPTEIERLMSLGVKISKDSIFASSVSEKENSQQNNMSLSSSQFTVTKLSSNIVEDSAHLSSIEPQSIEDNFTTDINLNEGNYKYLFQFHLNIYERGV